MSERVSFSKKKVDNYREETMLAGMILDEVFLRSVRTFYRSRLIKSKYVRKVADWCIYYYDKYETNPGTDIETFYYNALDDSLSDDESEAISRFIENLNKKVENGVYDNWNVEHALDEVENYFKLQEIENVKNSLEQCYTAGEVQRAESVIADYNSPQRPTSESSNPFTDADLILRAFEHTDPLYEFPGAVGELLNEFLVREGLVGIMGSDKTGKTWELIEHAMRASANRLNVAFFATGDSNKEKMARRKAIYITKKSDMRKYCGSLHVPVLDCVKNQCDTCRLRKRRCKTGILDSEGNLPEPGDEPKGYEPCTECIDQYGFEGAVWYQVRNPVDPLEPQEAVQWNRWWNKVRMRGKDFKLEFAPTGTMNVEEIEAQLYIWCYLEGWVPDVILVDYVDILKAEPGSYNVSERDKRNANMIALRRISQRWHCLVIFATQTDAGAYNKGLLDRTNFSEDKRMLAHVTMMYGLNQTDQEKMKRLKRRNVILARAGDYNVYKTVTCLECLEMGRPILDSLWTPWGENKG